MNLGKVALVSMLAFVIFSFIFTPATAGATEFDPVERADCEFELDDIGPLYTELIEDDEVNFVLENSPEAGEGDGHPQLAPSLFSNTRAYGAVLYDERDDYTATGIQDDIINIPETCDLYQGLLADEEDVDVNLSQSELVHYNSANVTNTYPITQVSSWNDNHQFTERPDYLLDHQYQSEIEEEIPIPFDNNNTFEIDETYLFFENFSPMVHKHTSVGSARLVGEQMDFRVHSNSDHTTNLDETETQDVFRRSFEIGDQRVLHDIEVENTSPELRVIQDGNIREQRSYEEFEAGDSLEDTIDFSEINNMSSGEEFDILFSSTIEYTVTQQQQSNKCSPSDFLYNLDFTVIDGSEPGTVSGVSGASINISGYNESATTDSDGEATATSLPPGNVSYTVSKQGYETESGQTNIDASGSNNVTVSLVEEEDDDDDDNGDEDPPGSEPPGGPGPSPTSSDQSVDTTSNSEECGPSNRTIWEDDGTENTVAEGQFTVEDRRTLTLEGMSLKDEDEDEESLKDIVDVFLLEREGQYEYNVFYNEPNLREMNRREASEELYGENEELPPTQSYKTLRGFTTNEDISSMLEDEDVSATEKAIEREQEFAASPSMSYIETFTSRNTQYSHESIYSPVEMHVHEPFTRTWSSVSQSSVGYAVSESASESSFSLMLDDEGSFVNNQPNLEASDVCVRNPPSDSSSDSVERNFGLYQPDSNSEDWPEAEDEFVDYCSWNISSTIGTPTETNQSDLQDSIEDVNSRNITAGQDTEIYLHFEGHDETRVNPNDNSFYIVIGQYETREQMEEAAEVISPLDLPDWVNGVQRYNETDDPLFYGPNEGDYLTASSDDSFYYAANIYTTDDDYIDYVTDGDDPRDNDSEPLLIGSEGFSQMELNMADYIRGVITPTGGEIQVERSTLTNEVPQDVDKSVAPTTGAERPTGTENNMKYRSESSEGAPYLGLVTMQRMETDKLNVDNEQEIAVANHTPGEFEKLDILDQEITSVQDSNIVESLTHGKERDLDISIERIESDHVSLDPEEVTDVRDTQIEYRVTICVPYEDEEEEDLWENEILTEQNTTYDNFDDCGSSARPPLHNLELHSEAELTIDNAKINENGEDTPYPTEKEIPISERDEIIEGEDGESSDDFVGGNVREWYQFESPEGTLTNTTATVSKNQFEVTVYDPFGWADDEDWPEEAQSTGPRDVTIEYTPSPYYAVVNHHIYSEQQINADLTLDGYDVEHYEVYTGEKTFSPVAPSEVDLTSFAFLFIVLISISYPVYFVLRKASAFMGINITVSDLTIDSTIASIAKYIIVLVIVILFLEYLGFVEEPFSMIFF